MGLPTCPVCGLSPDNHATDCYATNEDRAIDARRLERHTMISDFNDRELDLLERALDLRRADLVDSQDDCNGENGEDIHRMVVRKMVKENDLLRLKVNAIRNAQGGN